MLTETIRTYRAAYSGLPRSAWMLSFVVLINRSGTMVLTFLILYLTSWQGFSVPEAGRMMSLYGFGALMGALLGGWLTDRFNPWRVQMFSLVFGGLGLIVLGQAESRWGIAAAILWVSTISEAFRPANLSAMAQVCPPERRTRGFALNRLAINVGMTIGPAVGGFLARIDYHYLFWVDGVTCILAAVGLWYFFRSRNFESGSLGATHLLTDISPWRDGIFLSVMLLMILVGATFNQAFNTWPLYLKEMRQFIESDIGLLMAMNAFLVVLFEMPLIHRLEHLRLMKVITAGTLFFFAGFALLPLGSSVFFIAFTVVLWTIGEMLIFPMVHAFVAHRASEKHRGKYMGLLSMGFGMSFIIGPAVGTWVYEHIGADELWYLTAVVGVAAFAGFWLIDRRV